MGAFFYAQRFVQNYVYTLLENNHYICLDTNQWNGLRKLQNTTKTICES